VQTPHFPAVAVLFCDYYLSNQNNRIELVQRGEVVWEALPVIGSRMTLQHLVTGGRSTATLSENTHAFSDLLQVMGDPRRLSNLFCFIDYP
jgi:hypothetical protein